MKSFFNLFCLTVVILLSHYASANQNKFKINAEVIDFDPSNKIISLDGTISMTSDNFQISGTTATISMDEEVVGIFTDGDLRRALNQEIDIENNSVSSVMTKKFISISENDLAIDAATLMEKNKIFTLNVLNQKKQPSVITMHQLLEFGII